MQVVPYLMFNGNCEEALNFYAQALNGEVKNLMRFKDSPMASTTGEKDQVMHATLFASGNALLMASDSGDSGPAENGSGMVHLSLDFKNENEMLNVFSKLADSGTVTMDLQDTFWGAKFGMLKDRYGVKWMFNHDKKK